MGNYIYLSQEDKVNMKSVKDKELNEDFQAALLVDPTLLITERKIKPTLFNGGRIQYSLYHESPAADGSAYQARFQESGSGDEKVVRAYLHGVANSNRRILGKVFNTLNTPGISTERACGNTTRQADKAVGVLLSGISVIVRDHHERGKNKKANVRLLNIILGRLYNEHSMSPNLVDVDLNNVTLSPK